MQRFWRVTAALAAMALLLTGCGGTAETVVTTTALPSTTVTTITTAVTTTTTTVATTTTKKPVAAPTKTKVNYTPPKLDADYTRLLLVNAEHPLPSDYDITANLTSIDRKYCNGSLNQIDKDIHPYVIAMIEAAKADGVTLYVRSPYRSYATQKYLFNNKVNKVIQAGTPEEEAEAKAAQAVARPGTSEHQTGLAIDFNTASYKFENTAAHKWMLAHAAEYGFILRYPENKMDITGVMYEPWHWRFVGINTAQDIQQKNVTLEEYLDESGEASGEHSPFSSANG